MSELRHDPLADRWVIISPERGGRPSDIQAADVTKKISGFCPFCPGNEDKTPTPEIYAVLKNGCCRHSVFDRGQIKPDWLVRVFPNKFPALQLESSGKRKGEGIYDKIGGFGAHEIIVESQEHNVEIPHLPLAQVDLILKTLRDRMRDLKKQPRFRYLSLFKNKGADAGASLEHPHWQLNALSITPSEVARELRSSRDYYDKKERCLVCDILTYELEKGERIIESNESLVVLSPFASRFKGEIFIAPSPDLHVPPDFQSHSFPDSNDAAIEILPSILQRTLQRLVRKHNDPPYNIYLHTSPFWCEAKNGHGETIIRDYHWHLHIVPRLGKIAGFELGNDCFINTGPPEEAAKLLREAAV